MKAKEFKTKVKEIQNFLKGKEIHISLHTKEGCSKLVFNSLREFGNKILEIEQLGGTLSFNKVGNTLCEKRMITDAEVNLRVKRGTWNKVYIGASYGMN